MGFELALASMVWGIWYIVKFSSIQSGKNRMICIAYGVITTIFFGGMAYAFLDMMIDGILYYFCMFIIILFDVKVFFDLKKFY